MVKQGFGTPVAIALLIVLFTGIGLILASYYIAGATPDGKTIVASQDFINQETHILLMQYLQEPIPRTDETEELFRTITQPTIADAIIYFGEEEKNFYNESANKVFGRIIHDENKFAFWKINVNNNIITKSEMKVESVTLNVNACNSNIDFVFDDRGSYLRRLFLGVGRIDLPWSEVSRPYASSNTILPSKQLLGEQELRVTLEYCEVKE